MLLIPDARPANEEPVGARLARDQARRDMPDFCGVVIERKVERHAGLCHTRKKVFF